MDSKPLELADRKQANPATPLRVLMLEDRTAEAAQMAAELTRSGFAPDWRRVETKQDFLHCLDGGSPKDGPYQLILAEFDLLQAAGVDALQAMRRSRLDIAFIVVARSSGEEQAAEALTWGADDYLVADRLPRLGPAVKRALEQKRLRAEHKRSADVIRLQTTALESAADAVVITDRAGIIVWVNSAFQALTGYTLAEAVGLNPRDLVRSGRQGQAFYQEMWDTIVSGKVWRGVLVNRRKDGTLYDEQMTITPVAAANGEVDHFVAIKQDVTERRQAEAALAESEERLRTLFENAPVGIGVADVQGRLLAYNDAMLKPGGYARADVPIGFNVAALYAEPAQREEILSLAREQGYVREYEAQFRRKDGSHYTALLSLVPVTVAGQPAWQATVADISARREAEEALRQSEDRFRRLAENAPDLIYRYSFVPQPHFEYVSPAATGLTGYTPDEHYADPELGRKLVYPDDLPLLDAAQRGEIPAGAPLMLRWVRKDGVIFWTEQRLVPIQAEGGQLIAIEGIARDITDRKQAEAQIIQRNMELAALNQIGQTLSHLAEPDEILETVFEMIGTVLDNRNLYIALYDEAANSISFPVYTIDAETRRPAARPFGRGLTEHILRTRQPLLLSDMAQADFARLGVDPIGRPARSYLGVPLLAGDRALGVIALQDYDRPGPYTQRQADLLITIAAQAAVALNNARLYGETRRRAIQLATLNEVGRAVSMRLDLEGIFSLLLEQLRRNLPLDTLIIGLYDAASGLVSFPYVVDSGQRFTEASTPLVATGLVAQTIREGAPLLIRRTPADMLAAAENQEMGLGDRGRVSASVLYAPLQIRAQTVGVLSVQSYAYNAYTADDQDLLMGFAHQTAIAIHNARLFAETEQRLNRLQALRSIDSAISASLDQRLTFNIILEHVTAQLNVDAAALLRLNPHTQTLEWAAGRGFRTGAIRQAHVRLGEGQTGQAALKRETVQIPDLGAGPNLALRAALGTAEGIQAYFAAPLIAKGQVLGMLEIFHRTALHVDAEWVEFLETLAGQSAIAIENADLFAGLQRSNLELGLAYDATIEGWSRALDLRDKETEGHTERVTETTLRLARALGLSDVDLVPMRRGALLHDIGKMGIPDGILLKPGPLTDEEWALMRRHPQLAHDMLQPIAYLRPALEIPLYHHEHWDGTGYPRGLKGGQIPLAARIFAVVDVWDALRSDRPYRPGWPEAKVKEYIGAGAGSHFDPAVVGAFLKLIDA